MVGIDMQITLGFDVEINEAMTCDLVQHVVKERYAGFELLLTGTVEIDRDPDLGLAGVANDFCCAWHGHDEWCQEFRLDCSAARKSAFSAGVLTVTRKQFCSSVCILPTFFTSTFCASRRSKT